MLLQLPSPRPPRPAAQHPQNQQKARSHAQGQRADSAALGGSASSSSSSSGAATAAEDDDAAEDDVDGVFFSRLMRRHPDVASELASVRDALISSQTEGTGGDMKVWDMKVQNSM